MIITHHREKLINAMIYFARKTNFCGKTKLLKLLFLLDFQHFKQTGKSVTGLDYFAWEMGPVPKDLYEELQDKMKPDMKRAIEIRAIGDFQKIIPKAKFDADYFSNRELTMLDNLVFIYKDVKAEDMIEVTHLPNEPWDKTLKEKGEFHPIDYFLAIDNTVTVQ